MRIVHAIENLPGIGGAERITLTLAMAQKSLGMDVAICAAQDGYLVETATEQGIPVVVEPLLNPPAARPEGAEDAGMGGYLSRFSDRLAELEPDIVHGHLRYAGLSAFAAARKLDVPMVYTHHTIMFDFFLCAEFARGRAVPVISVSRLGADLIRRESPHPESVFHVPNGIFPVESSGVRLPRVGSRPNLIMSARLSAQKGIDIAVIAMKLLEREFGADSDAMPILHVFGDGPEKDHVRSLAERLDLSESVIFHGNVPDVIHCDVEADIVLVPSRTEACPLVVLEAMSAGIPLIASEVGGVPELIEDGVTGSLVTAESPVSLMEAIGELLGDPDRAARFAVHGRRKYQSEHTAEIMARRVGAVYAQIMASPR